MAICSVVLSAGCQRSIESKLVGAWRWKGCNDEGEVDAGDVAYSADHTFSSRDWAVNYSQQPPILMDHGEWHIRRHVLIMDFKGATRPTEIRHTELPFTFFGDDTLVVRATGGKVNTFERVK